MKPLLDTLGLLTLVVTDLDSIGATGTAKVRPERNKGHRTGNTTLKEWVPKKDGEGQDEAIPYTFEDSLALTNLELFRKCDEPVGLLKKLQAALEKDTLEDAGEDMFDGLEKGSKAEMALELLYLTEPSQVEPPAYIADGLRWLEQNLLARRVDVISTRPEEVNDV